MRVLMFGWEFPPHISGGLGTACYGLTSGLVQCDVEVLFVVPKLFGDEDRNKFRFINASDVAVDFHTALYKETLKQLNYIQIDSSLIPYLSPETSLIDTTFSSIDSCRSHSTSSIHFDFTGHYGKELMGEVMKYAITASQVARENRFDIIHAHDWLTYPAGIIAKQVSGKSLIVHVHATEFDRSGDHINQAVYEIEKNGMNEADAIVTVSAYTKQMLIDKYHIPKEKITIVHNGVHSLENHKKQSFSSVKKKQVVTFLGRVTFQKGPDYFIEAARKVLERLPDTHFVMAGSGDMLIQMIKRVAALRLSSRFSFTGFLRGDEPDRLYAMSDVYVMPSVSEPFGISPLEAARSGVPVIISKQSGVAEVLNNALKIDFWDTDALADAICGLLSYKTLSKVFSREASKEVELLTWKEAASTTKKLYQSFIHS